MNSSVAPSRRSSSSSRSPPSTRTPRSTNSCSACLDHYGVHVEELSSRTFLAVPAELTTDAFPELPPEGLTITADRRKALSREEIGFLTWDHPLVTARSICPSGSEQGNCAFGIWPGGKEQTIYVEAIYVLEPIAPPSLHADRFLPPTPLRIVVDPKGADVSSEINPDELRTGSVLQLLDNGRIKHKLVPAMLEKSREHATERATATAQTAVSKMQSLLGAEAARLRDLQKVNDHVRSAEITLLEEQAAELAVRLKEAPLRPRCRPADLADAWLSSGGVSPPTSHQEKHSRSAQKEADRGLRHCVDDQFRPVRGGAVRGKHGEDRCIRVVPDVCWLGQAQSIVRRVAAHPTLHHIGQIQLHPHAHRVDAGNAADQRSCRRRIAVGDGRLAPIAARHEAEIGTKPDRLHWDSRRIRSPRHP